MKLLLTLLLILIVIGCNDKKSETVISEDNRTFTFDVESNEKTISGQLENEDDSTYVFFVDTFNHTLSFDLEEDVQLIEGKASDSIFYAKLDSSRKAFKLWSYYHDRFMDFNDSTWKYMYIDLNKVESYKDSMLYYFEKQKQFK